MQTELRKHQHTLAVVGMGAIGFGIWSVVKAILYLTLVDPIKDMILTDYEYMSDFEYEPYIVLGLAVAMTAAVVLIDLHFRWKVGKKALEISKGDKLPTMGFFVRTSIVVLIDAVELVTGFLAVIGVMSTDEELLDSVSTLLVDLTSVVMLIEMIVAAVMIIKITKQLAAPEAVVQK